MNTKNIRKDRALYFSKYSELYDEIRPGYSDALFEEVAIYLAQDPDLKILEIGAGNGIATEKIHAFWPSELSLIEPGLELCEILEERFKENPNIRIIQDYFENVVLEKNSFDAIFCATAFHWLDKKNKYRRCHDLLVNGGLLVLFWNNSIIDNPKIGLKIQKIYLKYNYVKNNKCIYERQAETIENLKNEVIKSRFFELKEHKLFVRYKRFSSEMYIKLLKTYPSHSQFSDAFFEDIAKVIDVEGGGVDLRITTNLELAQKLDGIN